jgi:acyl carrier protein
MVVQHAELVEVLRDLVKDRVAVPVAEDAELVSLGLDSLSVIELMMAVEDRFGARIPVEGIGGGTTCATCVRSPAYALRHIN